MCVCVWVFDFCSSDARNEKLSCRYLSNVDLPFIGIVCDNQVLIRTETYIPSVCLNKLLGDKTRSIGMYHRIKASARLSLRAVDARNSQCTSLC